MSTGKQEALKTIFFQNPSRVMSYIPHFMLEYPGVNHDSFEDRTFENQRAVGSKWVDIWGTQWHKEFPDLMGLPCFCPLSGPELLDSYQWPDANDPRIIAAIRECRAEYDRLGLSDSQLLCGSHRDTLWEKSYMLVGMEPMMEYFYTEPEFAHTVLEKIMDFHLGIAQHYLEAGVEMVNLSDDLGSQSSLILSPAIIEEFLVPQYRRLFELYRKNNVIMNFHSCGHILPLLDLFVELGVNILNPVQATANELAEVARRAKGRLCISGGVSNVVLLTDDEQQIEAEVRRCISCFDQSGGYFCNPDQYMPYSKHSLDALERAVIKYGGGDQLAAK